MGLIYECYLCPGDKTLQEMTQTSQKPYICKVCKREESKKSYQRNKLTYQARAPRRRFESRNMITKLKSEPCVDCKTKFHFCQMDFDHRDPTEKRLPISRMGLMGINSILKEIAKCDLVCANCHRDRTQKLIIHGSKIENPDSAQLHTRQKAEEITKFVNSLKNNKKCVDCKLPHPYWRLDFDHRENSDKSNTISRLKLSKMSKERILGEIEKCDLICARCHRLRTWNRQRKERAGLT
jgi:hypothetical protein